MQQYKPLNGLRVVELSTFVAAPACTKLLAEWGAEVIKVESDKGDPFRRFGVNFCVPCTEEENPLYDSLNGGKRYVSLDIKNSEGKELLLRLLETADIFVTNNRDKALTKAGIDYDKLKDRFPRLIYAHLTGFGDTGPKKDNPGFDVVAFWASSGFLADMTITGDHSYPVGAPTGMGDIVASMMFCSAILSALHAREQTGHGDKVTTSLFGSAAWAMSVMINSAQEKYGWKYPKGRYDPGPTAYKTKDGEWVQTSILEHERYFPALCRVLGVPEMAEDPRFKPLSEAIKPENKRYQIELFETLYAAKTADEWVSLLTAEDIVADKLSHFKSITTDPQALENEFVTPHTMPGGETCYLVRPGVRFAGMESVPSTCGGPVGQDTEAVLRELGLGEDEIDALAERKAIQIKK